MLLSLSLSHSSLSLSIQSADFEARKRGHDFKEINYSQPGASSPSFIIHLFIQFYYKFLLFIKFSIY